MKIPQLIASNNAIPVTGNSLSKNHPTELRASRREISIAFLLPDLYGGGLQRVMLTVADALAQRGYSVTLLLCSNTGPLREQLPESIKLIELKASPTWQAQLYALAADPSGLRELLRPVILPRKPFKTLNYLPALTRYLRREKPAVLLTAMSYINVEAILARRLAAVPTRIVVSEHTHLSTWRTMSQDWRRHYLPMLMRRTYLMADAIVAVSDGVADDLAAHIGIPRQAITRIYNPAILPDLPDKAREAVEHPWFAPGASPVVLAVGRLGKQKDFPTLLRAFARVRATRPARLMMLGAATGPDKQDKQPTKLMALAAELGISDAVALLGFVSNPFAYMSRAAVLVLSSIYEGFGNVLVEAMACGCPVVSTDCPSGPAEILDNGQFGWLVPIGDDAAMAKAICAALDTPPDREQLRARAAAFSFDRAIDSYEAILLGNSIP